VAATAPLVRPLPFASCPSLHFSGATGNARTGWRSEKEATPHFYPRFPLFQFCHRLEAASPIKPSAFFRGCFTTLGTIRLTTSDISVDFLCLIDTGGANPSGHCGGEQSLLLGVTQIVWDFPFTPSSVRRSEGLRNSTGIWQSQSDVNPLADRRLYREARVIQKLFALSIDAHTSRKRSSGLLSFACSRISRPQ
jgi:hypothetical protein